MVRNQVKLQLNMKSYRETGKMDFIVKYEHVDIENHFKCNRCFAEYSFDFEVIDEEGEKFVEEPKIEPMEGIVDNFEEISQVDVIKKEESSVVSDEPDEVEYVIETIDHSEIDILEEAEGELLLVESESDIESQIDSISVVTHSKPIVQQLSITDLPTLPPDGYYLCCGTKYQFSKNYLKHRHTYHPNDITEPEIHAPTSSKKLKKKEGSEEFPILFKCKVCEDVFWTKNGYRRHMVCSHPEEAKEWNIQSKHYICDICDYNTYSRDIFRDHMNKHTNPDKLTCDECGKFFTFDANLRRHKKSVHEGKKPFVCDKCGARFSQKHSMVEHLKKGSCNRIKNYKGQPKRCRHCDETFKDRKSKRQHERIAHPLTSRHICTFCGKVFSESGNLVRHVRDIHGVGEQKEFKCSFCEKTYTQKAACQSHERSHTGEKIHTCQLCQQRFSDKRGLIRHIAIVHPDNPDYVVTKRERRRIS